MVKDGPDNFENAGEINIPIKEFIIHDFDKQNQWDYFLKFSTKLGSPPNQTKSPGSILFCSVEALFKSDHV